MIKLSLIEIRALNIFRASCGNKNEFSDDEELYVDEEFYKQLLKLMNDVKSINRR